MGFNIYFGCRHVISNLETAGHFEFIAFVHSQYGCILYSQTFQNPRETSACQDNSDTRHNHNFIYELCNLSSGSSARDDIVIAKEFRRQNVRLRRNFVNILRNFQSWRRTWWRHLSLAWAVAIRIIDSSIRVVMTKLPKLVKNNPKTSNLMTKLTVLNILNRKFPSYRNFVFVLGGSPRI